MKFCLLVFKLNNNCLYSYTILTTHAISGLERLEEEFSAPEVSDEDGEIKTLTLLLENGSIIELYEFKLIALLRYLGRRRKEKESCSLQRESGATIRLDCAIRPKC